LEIAGAKRLTDFDCLGDLGTDLTWLSLQACRNLNALDALAGLSALGFLNISECGPINSLGPIARLLNLETVLFYGSTKIEDNDLTPLLALPNLAVIAAQSRAAYRPSVSEVRSRIVARTAYDSGLAPG
jgi:hypothetical protein